MGNVTIEAALSNPSSRYGLADECDLFAEELWRMIMVEQPLPMPARVPFGKELSEQMLSNTGSHCVYFLALDQIGHHIIIETRAAQARLFQAYVRNDQEGYSGREWVTGKPDQQERQLPQRMLTARACWGGRVAMSWAKLDSLLTILLRLQTLAHDIAQTMQDQVPKCVREVEDNYNAQYPPKQGEQRIVPPGGVVSWTQEVLHCPARTTIEYDCSGSHIFSNDAYAKVPFSFQLPPRIAQPFTDAFAYAFGALPNAGTYLKILQFKNYKQMWSIHPQTGQPSAQGWASAQVTVPH